MKSVDDLNSELKTINARIDSVAEPKREPYHLYVFAFILAAAVLSLAVYFGPSITGFVTFSESVSKVETGDIHATKSSVVSIQTDLENINSVLLSGSVHGKGKAAVFLVKDGRNHLAYYFEGDAGYGENFTDMCYDTCHIEGLGPSNTLLFELEGTSLDINKVSYIYSKIIDFELRPISETIDYKVEKAKVIDLIITNTEKADFSVLLYVDGPLSNSFSWQGSLIHMSPDDTEKIIPITVKLPDNLDKGTYTNKITARYVPPDTFDFIGESPVAESFITVENS
jgi:hypothetical protein